jgi:membrane fusion protein, multidrug efflux system
MPTVRNYRQVINMYARTHAPRLDRLVGKIRATMGACSRGGPRTALLLLACLPLACGCSRAAAEPVAPPAASAAPGALSAPLSVSVAAAAVERVEKRVEITGTLAASDEAVVSIEAEGRLVALRADLGDRVRKGAVLAQIATDEYGFRKVQADAELAAAQADFDRVSGLSGRDMLPKQQLDESRRRLAVARTAAELAAKKIGDTTLRAPLDGTVSRRMVNDGEYVRVGAPAFQVVRAKPLKFRGDVPERYTALVRPGNAVLAWADSSPDRPLEGKVTRISPSVSVDTRAFPIEATVDNLDEAVKPGTFARLSILTGEEADAITIPDSAITEFAGNPRVFVVAGGKARERAVELGGKDGDRVIVAKGLAAGETVVTAGLDLLADGQAVAVRKD